MNTSVEKPTGVRYGVLGFACVLSMVTYLDRVCFGTVAPFIQSEFRLDPNQMGWIFGAFTFAYAVFEVPTGWLGDVFGPRKTLIRIVLWWSFFTALTGSIYPSLFVSPFLAMLAVRFLFGIGEAGAYPNIARAFHNWFPFNERGFAKGTVWMAGRFAGGVTPFVVLALVYETPLEGGSPLTHWRHIFWVFGGIGVVWCVLFWLWFRDRPEESPLVNQAELQLIHYGDPGHKPVLPPPAAPRGAGPDAGAFQAGPPDMLPNPAAGLRDGEPPLPARLSPRLADHGEPRVRAGGAWEKLMASAPWGKLLASRNLWLICFMYACATYGWYFNITYLPGFLKTQFHMDPGEKWTAPWWEYSLMAGLPLLFGSLACIVGGYCTDLFIKRTGNLKWGRRLFGMMGHGMCAVFYFLSMTVMSLEDPWPFVLCLAVASFWNDMTMGAAWASCIDIGRRYSGIVSGCMNTIGNLGGFLANVLTAKVLDHYSHDIDKNLSPVAYGEAMHHAWVVNFLIFSIVYVLAVLLWMGFDATKPIEAEPASVEA